MRANNMKYVYVLIEEGSWDYEFTNHTEVYSTFEKALNSYKNLVRIARLDMKEWIPDDQISESEQVDESTEVANFEIYQDGDFTKLHDTISIIRKEVM